MTTRQTAPSLKDNYGFGLTLTPTTFGHGGAHATNMTVDTEHGLVTVFLVQHTGGFPGNGKEALGAFKKAAIDKYGKR
jgi:CubicO group peptidase (beta-lactamase class C family)